MAVVVIAKNEEVAGTIQKRLSVPGGAVCVGRSSQAHSNGQEQSS